MDDPNMIANIFQLLENPPKRCYEGFLVYTEYFHLSLATGSFQGVTDWSLGQWDLNLKVNGSYSSPLLYQQRPRNIKIQPLVWKLKSKRNHACAKLRLLYTTSAALKF